MPKLTPIAAPEGYDKPYRFFRNDETGNCWKVQLEMREVRPPLSPGLPADAAPAELAVCVTVSPTCEDGRAVREDGRVVVIDSHTHTFTAVEMADPEFNADARIMSIVEERVAAGESRQAATGGIRALADDWAFAPPAAVAEPVQPPVLGLIPLDVSEASTLNGLRHD